MNRWLKEWSYKFLPGSCLLCGAESGRKLDLCYFCESDLPWIRNACRHCAAPIREFGGICPHCLKSPPPWREIICPFLYQPPLDYLIKKFKFDQHLVSGHVLGMLLALYIKLYYQKSSPPLDRRSFPDLIIPVPLHKIRLKERGYNQCLELGICVSDQLGIPVDNRCIRRVRDTHPQQQLARKARLGNVRAAFAIDRPVQGCNVALLDDVITTGSTLAEVTRLLIQEGARRVDVYALAKTDIPS
ncbi:MAG: ComF family protein [Gammaproteobacteria bacterium]|nr:ComF family protein [Gammaproteobacteria bacterium]